MQYAAILLAWMGVGLVDETAADRLTLRDGKVLQGQIIESSPRGPIIVAVRRAWAEENLPDSFAKWQKAEAPRWKQGRAQRLARLNAWRADRAKTAEQDDPVLAWIDAERERLGRPSDSEWTTLMLVSLPKAEVRKQEPADKTGRSLLRQSWVSAIDDPEDATVEDLRTALKKAFVSDIGQKEPPLDEFLPEPVEAEDHWRLRRAATEVAFDGPRFVRFEGLVVVEGEQPNLGDAQKAIQGLLGDLLGDRPAVDPLAEVFRKVEGRGLVGAIVTQMAMGNETTVASTLWVHTADRGWKSAVVRQTVALPDNLPADAGADLADDPQVKAGLAAFEGLGLGAVGDDMKRLGLRNGAAVQRSLSEVRSALENDLKASILPVRSSLHPKPKSPTPTRPE